MRRADIPFAVRLTNLEGWGIPPRDFERILRLDARGSFVATDGPVRVGLATTTSYGREIAWIGNVVVKKRYRGLHIGQSLVEHAISCLKERQVKRVALYSFNDNVQFYRRLRFESGPRFARFRRARNLTRQKTFRRTSGPTSLARILRLDRRAFGADRSRLIKLLLDSGKAWYVTPKTQPSLGYLLVKKYDDMNEIGPWVSFRASLPERNELLQLVLDEADGRPIEITCPLSNLNTMKMLKTQDFHPINYGRVMFYKRIVSIGKPDAVIAYGFLDKG